MGNESNELVTILIPAYNSEDTIIETIDSVYNQTYKNIELVIMDDEPAGLTAKKADEFLSKKGKDRFKRVVVEVNENNLGVSVSMNKGVRLSRGEYVLGIAADDMLMPDAVSSKLEFAKRTGQKVVFSKVEIFGSKDIIESIESRKRFAERGYKILEKSREIQFEEIIKDNYICGPSGGFYNRDFFLDDMGGYDERFPMLEDWPFILKYLSKGYRIELLNKITARYRISESSLCGGSSRKFFISCYDFFMQVRLKYLLERENYSLIQTEWSKYNELLNGRDASKKKFEKYYNDLHKWISIMRRGRKLEDYFLKNNFPKIAIYGYGDLGRLLEKDLGDSAVKIKYAIDKTAEGVTASIPILSVNEELPAVDAIIVTPSFDFAEIKDFLEKKVSVPIISIDDVINEVYTS